MQYSVDSFFFVAGFFLAYATLPRRMTSPMHYVIAIFNRYFRLIPVYFVVLLFFWQILPYLGSGPQWFIVKSDYANVCDSLWHNLLMLDNLLSVSGVDYCMGVSWYISNDFQLFIICLLPIFVYKSYNHLIARIICLGLVVINLMFTMGYCLYTGAGLFVYNPVPPVDVFNDVYTKFYHRMTPYAVGVLVGFSFNEMKEFLSHPDRTGKSFKQLVEEGGEELEIETEWPIMARIGILMEKEGFKWMKYVCYLGGAGLIFFTVQIRETYFASPDDWSLELQQAFNTLERPMFTAGLVLFLLPCLLGISKSVTAVLSVYPLRLVSKFSYSIYLIHESILLLDLFGSKQNSYFRIATFFDTTTWQFIVDLLLAMLLHWLVEIPFDRFQKIQLAKLTKPRATPAENINESLLSMQVNK